ncbi:MAG: ATP-binding cassette domain-containing protein [Candidatus Omnitrophica bacterium]|nr:ATP-binding cassette domain-containing protein [Candidatus Omnitrophota bacterium]
MIDVNNISMYYGSIAALKNVSFSVNEGEILGLLGPNGAGKTTLMKILTTFLYPSGGTAKVSDFDILDDPLKVREMIGYMPESVPLYVDMRVDEYLRFVGIARGITGSRLKEQFDWLKESCGIKEVWKHGIHELSKGYRQRVGLAQALIHEPKVLILDEPTSGLDPLQIIDIRKLIKNLAKDRTIIFSTHILQQVAALADRIVIINEGAIIAQGTAEELAARVSRDPSYILTVMADQETARKGLEGLRYAKEITLQSESSDGLVTFEIKALPEGAAVWQEIDQLNKQKQWPVKSFSERPQDLEQVFISILAQTKQKVSVELQEDE